MRMNFRKLTILLMPFGLLLAVGSAWPVLVPGHGAVIDNGLIKLGVRFEGHLNIPGAGIPSRPSSDAPTTAVGLRLIFPDGSESEATAPGCLCEGWGASADGVSGYANVDVGGVVGMGLVSFADTPTTAVSVVDIGGVLEVTHDYHPSASPNLYEVTVTLTNTSGGDITDLRYRRVMDWDISPTTFVEFVTIDSGTAVDLVLVTNNGFDTSNPLSPANVGGSYTIGDRVDDGPRDHGAFFQFEFADVSAGTPLADGESKVFTIYYGAAFNEPDAVAALTAVGAEAFSFGQPNTAPPADHGEPNTFIFAFSGVGGEPIFTNLSPTLDFNPPGTNHTVDLEVLGANIDGIDVNFEVISGPNAGDNGTDTTTGGGLASYTYTGDGGIGVDEIQAFFLDERGDPVESNIALKFWDNDCQINDIPDTCDIDCGGFDGQCGEYPACGGSQDAGGDGVPDECNMPPDCSSAGPGAAELWPPNHKFQDITVEGVTDPDGDAIVITIDSIFQDEPTDTFGDGKTCPDGAGVGTDMASVRSERSGTKKVPGDGRVYHIGFTADDGNDAQCSSTVTVCVPHDQRRGHVCIDQGALYDSTVCGL